MPALLGDAVAFSYLTRDHDLGSADRYENIKPDVWASYPHGQVFYATKAMFGMPALSKAMSTFDADVIYLNSFFSFRSSISIVVRNWLKPFGTPILLAPRGEFSPGALALKSCKKRLFLTLARTLGLYRSLWWHASTGSERQDILRVFPNAAARILTAEDPVDMPPDAAVMHEAKAAGMARLVFVSRISPMKNLDGLLHILAGVTGRVTLRIYGPIEDEAYWQRCQAMISDLPSNVVVEYLGALHPDDVSSAFSKADLFAFPTHGENFGHVIFEAMRAGTPVAVSDQTPWQADATGAVTRLPLDAVDVWRAQIEMVVQSTNIEHQARRDDALLYARRHATSDKTRQDNLRMFQEVVRRSQLKAK
ncbi:glycosyltransferase [Sphingobium baderi]|uniref:Glycosyl transferase family 1 domain-containing protein n=1 Tax=Sphingobium baderi LL03 TaxID=1114964 RepID=T0I532_9SPHN|nr:glycosyltransferase [Sphingobium baderi]EQB04744.1 hypothetical protein L485_03865 [Sphingobium baderi LL03]KMS52229.1 hypothetical protein V475_22250 [Sphingobium baderi LL03]